MECARHAVTAVIVEHAVGHRDSVGRVDHQTAVVVVSRARVDKLTVVHDSEGSVPNKACPVEVRGRAASEVRGEEIDSPHRRRDTNAAGLVARGVAVTDRTGVDSDLVEVLGEVGLLSTLLNSLSSPSLPFHQSCRITAFLHKIDTSSI